MINIESAENSFIKAELCHIHTPCPLGENRERFLHLVHAIRERKDDYAAQLSSLTLAELSRSTSSDGESERDIARAIFDPQSSPKPVDAMGEKEEKLWKSRLVLAIAEILDLEQEEIARGLAELDDEQKELFQSLHGDDSPEEDTPLAELTQLEKNMASADSRTEKNRTKAWTTIFREAGLNDFELLLTTSRDSADIMLERYEAKHSSQPLQLASLELPGLIGWNSHEALEAVLGFTTEHDNLLDSFNTVLQQIATKQSLTPNTLQSCNFSEFSIEWQLALEETFPALRYGRDTVTIYALPSTTCADILLENDSIGSKEQNAVLIVID